MDKHTGHFRDKTIIITGASSGIGKALALQLASGGAKLALAARNIEKLSLVAQECQALGSPAAAIPTDVADEAQCQRLIQETVNQFGGIDMLINNAGFGMTGKFGDLPDLALFKRLMQVNFDGMLHCSYYALPSLLQRHGRIVNIASNAGKVAIPYNSAYTASKFAMAGFSDSLRLELAKSGVSVTVVYPYWVISEFHENMLNKEGERRGPRGRAIYTRRTLTSDRCASIILKAASGRMREVVMQPGKAGVWLKTIAPGLLDWIIVNWIFRPLAQRINQKG